MTKKDFKQLKVGDEVYVSGRAAYGKIKLIDLVENVVVIEIKGETFQISYKKLTR